MRERSAEEVLWREEMRDDEAIEDHLGLVVFPAAVRAVSVVRQGCHSAALVVAVLALALAAGPRAAHSRPPLEPSPSPSVEERRPLPCHGQLVQGGAAVCSAEPGSRVRLGSATTRAGADGTFVIGFDRDAPRREVLRVWRPDGRLVETELEIAPRPFDVSRIDGLPPGQVSSFTPEQLARIESSSARKREGDASRAELAAYRAGFVWPLEGRKTSSFGAQRILNGTPKRPHYGVDLAAPVGTPVVAPADGVVTLADDDLYFEGAMVVVDHGQGFLSKYLHLSRIDVAPGQRVTRGTVLGAVGSRGRSTGPHLCWRLKWRDRNLDPELWVDAGAR